MKRRLEELIKRYGAIALWTYLAISAVAIAGFAIAIHAGVDVDSAAGGATTLVAAWLAAKTVVPLRIAATVVLTPLIARGLDVMRGRGKAPPAATP